MPFRVRRSSSVLAVLALLMATLAWVAVRSATPAAAAEGLLFAKSAPGTVLYGSPSEVTLRATNTGDVPVYNASFRDVLPPGVTIATSTPAPTRQIANQPSSGYTTVIWENVNDILPGSSTVVTYSVTHTNGTDSSANPLHAGDSYTNSAAVFANNNPRMVPDFTATGAPVAGPDSYTSTGSATATTTIVPLRIAKTEASSEGELLRGVHDNAVVYTLTVTNNSIAPTNTVVVDDYLSAQLEFLGCGGVENSAGPTPEYSGAPLLTVVPSPGGPCPTPVLVETVTNPPGKPAGVYTHVRWAIGNLAAGQVTTINYRAGIPLRANVQFAGNATANLDNNTGALTTETAEQAATNFASAGGTYAGFGGASATDSTSLVRSIEDLAIKKGIVTGESTAEVGEVVKWRLSIFTSEYRSADQIVVTDVLPDGYAFNPGSATVRSISPTIAGPFAFAPTSVSTITGSAPGTQTLAWDFASMPTGLPSAMASGAVYVIEFDTTTLGNYRATGLPVLTFDTLTNNVSMTGVTSPIAAVSTVDTGTKAVSDVSSAGQTSAWSGVDKSTVWVGTPSTLGCSSPVSTTPIRFTPGDTVCYRLTVPFPSLTRLKNATVTDFIPPNSTYKDSAVLPSNTVTIAPGSPASTPSTAQWSVGVVEGSDRYTEYGSVFDWVIATTLSADPSQNANVDITANLLKVSAANTAGTTTSQRDLDTIGVVEPDLSLRKGIKQINSGPAATTPDNGTGPATSGRHDAKSVLAGDTVVYRIDVANTGPTDVGTAADAMTVQIWDVLPAQLLCSDVSAFPATPYVVSLTANNGDPFVSPNPPRAATAPAQVTAVSCVHPATGPDYIAWTLSNVPSGFSAELNYTVTIPTGTRAPVAGEALDNHAGIREFTGPQAQGTGSPVVYYPASNIDPTTTANSPAADDWSRVVVPAPAFAKTRTTSINEANNNADGQATYGEDVHFAITATIPEGVAIRPTIEFSDVLDSRLAYVPGTASVLWGGSGAATPILGCTNVDTCSFDTDDASAGTNPPFSLTTSAATVKLTSSGPDRYDSKIGADVFTIRFTARVVGGANGASVPNVASFNWVDALGAVRTAQASVATTLVGPAPAVTKTHTGAGPFKGGDVVPFTLTATNAAGSSPLHDVVVTDCVPKGLIVNPGTATTTTATPNPAVAGVVGLPGSCAAGGTLITWTLPAGYALLAGTPLLLTYSITIGADEALGAGLTATNTAQVAGDSVAGDPTAIPGVTDGGARSYSAQRTDILNLALPVIDKSVTPTTRTPGQLANYTVRVTIPRGLRVYDGVVRDVLPANLGLVSGSDTIDTTGCTLLAPAIAPHVLATSGTVHGWFVGDIMSTTATEDCVITITYQGYPVAASVDAEVLTNTATLLWNNTNRTGDLSAVPLATGYDRSITDTANITVKEPKLTIAKAVDDADAIVEAGQTLTYTIRIRNTGTADAFDINVTDVLPSALLAPTAISDGGVYTAATAGPPASPATLAWTLFTGTTGLAPNAEKVLTYTQKVTSAMVLGGSSSQTNVAAITEFWADPVHGDPRYESYVGPSADATVRVDVPALAVAKTVADGSELGQAEIDKPFTWKVVITNTGTATAYGVDLADALPAQWTYEATSSTVSSATTCAPSGAPVVSGAVATGQTVTWTNLCDLPSLQTITITFTATPNAGALPTPYVPGTIYTNRATASASDLGGEAIPAATDTATATIKAADLRIVKRDQDATFVIGETGHYYVEVANLGPNPEAGPVSVSDTLPAGLVLAGPPVGVGAGAAWTCTGAAGDTSFTCTLTMPTGGLATGASVQTIDVPVNVTEGAIPLPSRTAAVTNTASVTGTTYDTNPANNEASEPTPIARTSDYAINKARVNPAPLTAPIAGTDVTYALTITHLGPSPATGLVTVTDALPAGLKLKQVPAGTGWNCATSVLGTGYTATTSGTARCTRTETLLARDTVLPTITVVATVNPAASQTAITNITNVATVTSPHDVNPTNDTSNHVIAPAPVAELTIEKSDGGAVFVVGQQASYTIAVTNSGPSNENGPVTVSDVLPVGLKLLSVAGAGSPSSWDCTGSTLGTGFTAGSTGTVTCTHTPTAADSFGPGEALDLVVVRVLVGANAAPITDPTVTNTVTNTARVTGVTDTTPSLSNIETPVQRVAQLSIDKSHSAATEPWEVGATESFSLTVSNAGPSPEHAPIVVTDTLPVGLAYVSAAGTSWACTNSVQLVTCTYSGTPLAAAAALPAITVRVKVLPTAAPLLAPSTNTVTNSATVRGVTDPVLHDDSDTVAIRPLADLAVTKTHTGDFIVGRTGTFDLAVVNNGPSAAAAPITVVDTLPAGLTFDSFQGDGWACVASGSTVTCTSQTPIAALAPAPVIHLTVAIGPAAEAGVTNTAKVTSPTKDPVPTNDTSTDAVTAIPSSDLVMAKAHTDTEFYVGVPASYTLTVSNAGPSANAGPITVTDPLPAGMTLTAVAGDGWDCSASSPTAVACTRPGPVPAGTVLPVITLAVEISPSAVPAGLPRLTLVNTARVASPVLDLVPDNNADPDPTEVVASADLGVVKSHAPVPASAGTKTVAFVIQAHNYGPGPTLQVLVTDTLPSFLTYVGFAGTGWSCAETGTGVLSCTYPNRLNAGQDAPELIITAKGDLGGGINTAVVSGSPSDLNPDNDKATDPIGLALVLPVDPIDFGPPTTVPPTTVAPTTTAAVGPATTVPPFTTVAPIGTGVTEETRPTVPTTTTAAVVTSGTVPPTSVPAPTVSSPGPASGPDSTGTISSVGVSSPGPGPSGPGTPATGVSMPGASVPGTSVPGTGTSGTGTSGTGTSGTGTSGTGTSGTGTSGTGTSGTGTPSTVLPTPSALVPPTGGSAPAGPAAATAAGSPTGTPVTAPAAAAAGTSDAPDSLPFTGSRTPGGALAGLLFVAIGVLILAVSRRRGDSPVGRVGAR